MHTLFTALITPFTPEGTIDLAAIPPHLRWLEANGVDGVVPAGTTGEGPSLSLAERKALIKTVVEHRGNLRVFAGTGCANLPETIEATRYALEVGAEVAMVLPPFFFKEISDAGLLAYYRAVCDNLPAGGQIMLYHIPPVSQIAISKTVIEGLLESHPQAIFGIKDSGRDDDYTAMLIGHFPQIQVFTGTSALLAHCLADGGAGGIFAIANLFPRELRAVIDAFHQGGDSNTAQQHIAQIDKLVKPTVPALKALLPAIADLPATSPRFPLLAMSDSARDALISQLQQLS